VAQNEEAAYGGYMSVDDVTKATFAALDRASVPPHVIPGAQNTVYARLSTLAPRRAVLNTIGRQSIPGRTT
jgi:hypothetical protein